MIIYYCFVHIISSFPQNDAIPELITKSGTSRIKD